MHLLVSEWDLIIWALIVKVLHYFLLDQITCHKIFAIMQWMINFIFSPHFLVSHKIWFDFFFLNLGNIFKWNNTFLWNIRVHLTFTNHLIMSHELCNRTSKSPQIKTAVDREGTKLIRIFTPEEDSDPRRDFWFFIDHF